MRIGDGYRLSAIGMKDFLAAAKRLSLEAEWAESRVTEISDGLVAAFGDSASEANSPLKSRPAGIGAAEVS